VIILFGLGCTIGLSTTHAQYDRNQQTIRQEQQIQQQQQKQQRQRQLGTPLSARQSPQQQTNSSANDPFLKGFRKFLKRDYVGAIPDLLDAVHLAPDNLHYLEILGQSYLRSGDAQSAIGPLTRAVNLKPGWESADIRMHLAQAYDLLGMTDFSQQELRKALEAVKGRPSHRAKIDQDWRPLLAKYKLK
jgi:predicted Zn-dependent protease